MGKILARLEGKRIVKTERIDDDFVKITLSDGTFIEIHSTYDWNKNEASIYFDEAEESEEE